MDETLFSIEGPIFEKESVFLRRIRPKSNIGAQCGKQQVEPYAVPVLSLGCAKLSTKVLILNVSQFTDLGWKKTQHWQHVQNRVEHGKNPLLVWQFNDAVPFRETPNGLIYYENCRCHSIYCLLFAQLVGQLVLNACTSVVVCCRETVGSISSRRRYGPRHRCLLPPQRGQYGCRWYRERQLFGMSVPRMALPRRRRKMYPHPV